MYPSRIKKGGVNDGYSQHGRRYLVLLSERHVSPAEFTHVPAVPTQAVCANLCSRVSDQHEFQLEKKILSRTHFATSVMPQVVPVHVKFAVIVHVYELVCQGILHLAFATGMVLA